MKMNYTLFEPWKFIDELREEYGDKVALDILRQGSYDAYHNTDVFPKNKVPMNVELRAKEIFKNYPTDKDLLRCLEENSFKSVLDISINFEILGYDESNFTKLLKRYDRLVKEGKVEMELRQPESGRGTSDVYFVRKINKV